MAESSTDGVTNRRVRLMMLVFSIIVLVLVMGTLIDTHVIAPSTPAAKEYAGSLFVSDAGQSHGGFEYPATWDAIMKVVGTTGVLNLTLNIGLGDALQQHIFNITNFGSNSSSDEMSFVINKVRVTMVNNTRDEIWNGTFNNYLVASWGGYAPPQEKMGTITPEVFPGLAPFWYVELRLR
jgi:hypothetical protein